jgi:hypothetical protein
VRADTDTEQVAATVELLTDDVAADRLGAAGRACFLEKLTWDRAAQPLLDLIDELS